MGYEIGYITYASTYQYTNSISRTSDMAYHALLSQASSFVQYFSIPKCKRFGGVITSVGAVHRHPDLTKERSLRNFRLLRVPMLEDGSAIKKGMNIIGVPSRGTVTA